ncbi:unnamed protein product [Clavelina lepadiformis]|uniref:Uncharacterized protein n=1 Tax=Clavelina lepadiformis TaxID=159417 RepID=A0ABP0FHS6_CLALP
MEEPLMVLGDSTANVMKRLKQAEVNRKRSKTKEELTAITTRIQNTLDDYDDSNRQCSGSSTGNVELVTDMDQIEAILKDDILKNKYQQKMTIFIVGYKDACLKRLDILGQLSEFFNTYVPSHDDEEDIFATENYVASLNLSIQDTLGTMENALSHLDDVGRDVLKYMGHLHHQTTGKSMKNKKKLEKALQSAKDELIKMTNKITRFQQDIGLKDDRLQQLNMHLDAKRVEIMHMKKEADALKKNYETVQDGLKQERNTLQLEVDSLQETVENLQTQQTDCSVTNTVSSDVRQKHIEAKLQEIRDAALIELESIKERTIAQQLSPPVIEREIAEHFQVQLEQINQVHEEEVEMWTQECRTHIHNILEMELTEEDTQKWMHPKNNAYPRVSSLSTKDKPFSPYQTSSVYSDAKPSSPKDQAFAVVDEAKTDELALDDISLGELKSKFQEYRDKTEQEMSHLKERIFSLEAMQQNMTNEAMKWQEERSQLLIHVEELKMLQEAAEADAEEAMRNLEEFAEQQEQRESQGGGSESQKAAEDTSSSQLTENNVENLAVEPQPSSPSTFSKPESPATSRSLASAYRQKIAERREAINKRKREGLASRGAPDTPQLKGMFDTGLLEEFLRSYRAVVEFKDWIAQEMSRYSALQGKAHTINDVHTTDFDATNDQVQLYVSNMSTSIEQSLTVIKEGVSSAIKETQPPLDSESEQLRQNNLALQEELVNLRSEYEKRTQHDAAVIMHMQNTISETQRGNTTAAGTSGSGFPSSPAGPVMGKTPGSSHRPATDDSDLTIVFSRRDADQNTKALKKSVAVGKLAQATVDSVVVAMEAYNSIPARRIQHLANKLMHHTKMKVIETNVRNSNLLTSEVFSILEKMETLQHRRAQEWGRQMDEMTSERRRLGALLTNAFQRLESITGVFLIKPIISYRGKGFPRKYTGKISTRFNKYQAEAMLQKMQLKQTVFDGSGPSDVMQVSVLKSPSAEKLPSTRSQQGCTVTSPMTQKNTEPLNVSGLRKEQSPAMWNAGSSLAHSMPTSRMRKDGRRSPVPVQIQPSTVPRMLEMDIGRYQHDLTSVHSFIPPGVREDVGHDRIRSMELLQRRFHASVSRTGLDVTGSKDPARIQERATKGSPDFKSMAPPTTPTSQSQQFPHRSGGSGLRMRSSDDVFVVNADVAMTSPKPLPPIRTTSTHSTMSSAASSRVFSPTKSAHSRSMPDMSALEESSQASTPFASKKEI